MKQWLKRLLAAGLPDVAPVRFLYRLAYRFFVLVFETGLWLRKILVVEPTVRAIASQVGRSLRIERVPYVRGQGKIRIGDRVYISGKIGIQFNSRLNLDPLLEIGDHTFVGHGCSFNVARGIRIGTHCLLAGGTAFYDNDGHPLDPVARRHEQPVSPDEVRPIVVGDDVWIGARCLILKGVRIGDRAVVGAGSVVIQDVPADCIVAGNPARLVRSLPAPAAEPTQLH